MIKEGHLSGATMRTTMRTTVERIATPDIAADVRTVGEAAATEPPGPKPEHPTLTPRQRAGANHARECAAQIFELHRLLMSACGASRFDVNLTLLRAWTSAWLAVAVLECSEGEPENPELAP
jgi:hypothetical protein